MRLSLADAAVAARTPVATKEQELLASGDIDGLIALKRSIFGDALMVADDDDAGDDGDDDGDDDDLDDGDDDGDDDDAGKGKKETPEQKAQKRISELSAENKRYRQRAVARGKRVQELEAELAKVGKKPTKDSKDDADDEDDKPSAADRKLQQENEELKTRLMGQQLRSEFNDLITGTDAEFKFKSPRAAFKLLDLDDVEVGDDGKIDGLAQAIADLAKAEPYLLVEDKDDDDDEDDEKPKPRKTGQPTGQQKRKRGNPNRDKLLDKYPALRR